MKKTLKWKRIIVNLNEKPRARMHLHYVIHYAHNTSVYVYVTLVKTQLVTRGHGDWWNFETNDEATEGYRKRPEHYEFIHGPRCWPNVTF